MGRMVAAGLLACLGVIGLLGADEPAPRSEPVAQLVPDPDWRPRAGDRVTVRPPGTPAFAVLPACERYTQLLDAGDADGLRDLASRQGVVQVAADTPVLVIRPHGLPAPSTGAASPPDRLNRDIQDAINRAASRPRPVVSAEVRILEGPHKGLARFVPAASLARMVPPPASAALKAGDRMRVGLRPVAMARDEDYLLQYARDPGDGDSRARVTMLPLNTRLVILEARASACKVRILPNSRLAGRVGYVKADNLEVARPEPEKPGAR